MEEKGATKISFSTFLLVIAIIAIIVMGVFMYKLNNDKSAGIEKSDKLQAQVNDSNVTISELQRKLDSISNTINTTTSINESNNNNSNTNRTNKVDIAKIAGEYISSDDTSTTSLNLYTNGIFAYEYSKEYPIGVMGNYTINDNKITLTYWFNTASDVDLKVTKGEKNLTINSDNSITDDNFKHSDTKTVKLVKKSDLQNYELGNRLAVAFFSEENHTMSEPNM